MAKRKVTPSEETAVVEKNVPAGPSVSFLEKNQHLILYAVGAIALVVLGWFLYKSYVVAPKQKEAAAAMWPAQMSFERDSFPQALNGPDGGYEGFLSIINNYSGTPAANAAKYYAAVCYLQTGDFDSAIQYMEDFSPKDALLPAMKYGVLGDCYSEKKDFSKALNYYEKAADGTENELLAGYYLKKLGMLYEHEGKSAESKAAFEKLRKNFPNPSSQDWNDAEKYIYRAGGGK